ncbi:MAG: hypothetical protein M3Q68_06430 [Actinomycetota bacterium]|nr:hypothetical protein [Actinomycetota bacterium]
MSVEAAKWTAALQALGFVVRPVALWADSPTDIEEAIDGVDVVVVENVLSLPLDPPAAHRLAQALQGRPAIVRHHDLPWQRSAWPDVVVADDPAWTHVVINSIAAAELSARQGIRAHVLPNRFPLDGWLAAQPHDGRVLLHPVRAIARKDVSTAVALAERLGVTYWLTGPAEDGYDDELRRILRNARCPVRHEAATSIATAYAACDAVAFPSTLEGFGNPVVEAALARRPLAVRPYPVLVADLAPLGFRWFAADDGDGRLTRFLDDPDVSLLDHNEALARTHFGLDRLPGELSAVLDRVL